MGEGSTEDERRTLATYVGNLCSNPDCRTWLGVSQADFPEELQVGVVIQIEEVDPHCPSDNGIWLCRTCANLVNERATQYPEAVLRAWRTVAEHHARFPMARKATAASAPRRVPPESKSRQKSLAILPWKGKIVTLSERVASDKVPGLGPKLAYSQVRVLDCTESHVMVSKREVEGSMGSISLENIEVRIDASANQLELHVRRA